MNADAQTRDPHSVNNLSMDEELPRIQVDHGKPIIVAHHSPIGLKYVSDFGTDVFVAGHTHGGQVFPATLLVGRNFPIFKGMHRLGKTTIAVSEGAGTFGPWMRLGSRAKCN